jgi:predicted acylesterase/phospholipase RssA
VGGPGSGLVVKDPYADGNMVVLTVSGGGMRASAFTLGVLAELDLLTKDRGGETAFEEIDLISSVSGGSWAVAAVLADRAKGSTAPLASRMQDIEARYAALASAKVKHWADRFIPAVTHDLTFGEVYSGSMARPLPFAYFNASLYPSQSPFVFTPEYLNHYRVTALGDPAEPRRVPLPSGRLADIPIGYAASASGAVPGYTSAFAETALCDEGLASYCFKNRKGGVRDNLQLVDGGLYDNVGYKTALELGLKDRSRIGRLPATVIMVDTADDEAFQTMPNKGKEGGHVFAIARASSFPNQNATFDRLRGPGFQAAGFDRHILLDFGAAASFNPELHDRHLRDLPELAYHAAHDVSCYGRDGRIIEGRRKLKAPRDPRHWEDNLRILRSKGSDCLALNFARVGYLHKTTFKYDPYAFKLRYQLGRLAVRMNEEAIKESVFRTARTPLP